ncbi:TauD/TfdA family dioxygenase [Streptosporangiaceae bacterium NEAU-GS5]|nr:TauD/TfdA family dioxygenase [Streptosporangiaceae bacterium NEAU-GS5]
MGKIDIPKARDELAERGWTVIQEAVTGAPDGMDGMEGVDSAAVLDLASRFGTPSSRDSGALVWEVRPREGMEGGTFSEVAGAIPFHTDAQYRAVPEALVALFVVRPARDGGHTRLLTARSAFEALAREPYGEEIRAELKRPRWRWVVPESFREPDTPPLSPPAAVIESGDTVRWRPDNLVAPDEQGGEGAARFASCLAHAPGAVELDHHAGDLIVLDNRRVLHARGAFRDPRRLLLRIRLWAS